MSVGDPRGSCGVFCTKEGQLESPVSHVTFFAPKEVSWGPALVAWQEVRSWEHPKMYLPDFFLAPRSHPLCLAAHRAALA